MRSNASDQVATLRLAMRLQTQEIVRLSQQVEKLQSTVERLLADKS